MARGLSLLMAAPVVLVTMVVALAIGGATKWVRVTYRTTAGEDSAAWFADGSSFGWSGLSRGTERLYELIRARTMASDHDALGEMQACEPMILGPSSLATRGPAEEPCPWCDSPGVPDADGRCPSCNRPIA